MNYIYHFPNEAFGINEFSQPVPKETKRVRERRTIFSKEKTLRKCQFFRI